MNVTFTRENLLAGLEVVSRVASKNITLPILNNVLVRASQGVVTLQTTNLEIVVSTTVRAKITTDGEYTVQARLFHDVVRSVRGQQVHIEVTTGGLLVTTNDTTTTLKGISAEDFPLPPQAQTGIDFEVPSNALKSALEEVVFAAANDEARPELSGVLIRAKDKEVQMVATDSYRLSQRNIQLPEALPEGSAIIPVRAAHEVLRILENDTQAASIHIDEQQLTITLPETTIISRVIDGRFPDFEQIIPQTHETTATVSKSECIEMIKAASLFCQPGVNDVTLHFDTEKKSVECVTENAITGAYRSSLSASISGPALTIVFNYRYLLDGLQSLHGDEVVFDCGDTQAAVLLHGTGQGLYLLMPIRQ
jgi:DNA polymerase-3 subunit beta